MRSQFLGVGSPQLGQEGGLLGWNLTGSHSWTLENVGRFVEELLQFGGTAPSHRGVLRGSDPIPSSAYHSPSEERVVNSE
jgi:hypothetical protein